nr:MAG TPA: hypothetical protein [Caudoviricetes sp.]
MEWTDGRNQAEAVPVLRKVQHQFQTGNRVEVQHVSLHGQVLQMRCRRPEGLRGR